MKITVAESAGFCFGVKRAVSELTALTESGDSGKIYTVGELIHNRIVLDEFERRGVSVIGEDDIDRVYEKVLAGEKATVVIRTHGVTKEISDKLEKYAAACGDFAVRDLTCPFVRKIHKIAEDNTDRFLIVFGDENHPEVKGIVSRAAGGYKVIAGPEDAEKVETGGKPVCAVAQTTQSIDKWKKIEKNIEKVFTNSIIFDTICSVTEKRQAETDVLSRRVDAMLIIGSPQSSNTNKLYEISRKNCENTFFIETAEDLSDEFGSFRYVGITAGASTPERVIQEVYKEMSEIREENFAEMLEDSLKTLNTGDIVKGTVSSVSGSEIYVDLGAKATGIISADEATDDSSAKLSDLFAVGDEIDAIVLKVSDRDGVAELSKKRVDNRLKWKKVADAAENGEIIEGVITDAVKGGVVTVYEGTKIFIPASQTGISKTGDLNELVGQTKRYKIIEADDSKKRAIGSIRKVENSERKAKVAAFWNEIEIGKYYDGVVRSITSYGAFVDLGGVDGMVHSTELSWTHIKSPADVVSVGETIRVFVKDFNRETKRISLGYKTEETNPWTMFKAHYALNDIIAVKIVSLMSFGAFAEIMTGVDGLIHISQISNQRISAPADVLKVGQEVNVEIVGIDDEKHQVALSMRTLLENAAEETVASTEETETEEAADAE